MFPKKFTQKQKISNIRTPKTTKLKQISSYHMTVCISCKHNTEITASQFVFLLLGIKTLTEISFHPLSIYATSIYNQLSDNFIHSKIPHLKSLIQHLNFHTRMHSHTNILGQSLSHKTTSTASHCVHTQPENRWISYFIIKY